MTEYDYDEHGNFSLAVPASNPDGTFDNWIFGVFPTGNPETNGPVFCIWSGKGEKIYFTADAAVEMRDLFNKGLQYV